MEAVHGMIYFTADAQEAYAKVGITKPRPGYFASRSAALGAVPAEVVIATFYNFHPGLVRKSMHDVWELTTPEAMIAARYSAADSSLRRAFGDEVMGSAELAEAATSTRQAALVACERPEGRPLFAGHVALGWPDDDQPHLVLWHGQTLLREFRGDGHVAALTLEGLTGLEALITHAATGDVPADVLKMSRRWSDDEWQQGIEGLAARGIVDDTGCFTDKGREQRQRIEDATDRLAVAPYEAIGDDAAERLRETGKKFSQLIVDAGLLTVDPRLVRDRDD
jgi:Helix-turn-helix family